MSETEEDPKVPIPPDAEFDDPATEPEQATSADVAAEPAPEIVIGKRGGASATVAWLALFLGLLTTAGIGYTLLEKYRADSVAADETVAAEEVAQQLSDTNRTLAELRDTVERLEEAEQHDSASLDALRNELDSRTQLFDSLPSRMNNIERGVAALQGVSLDTRNTYLVAEAEYYLQIANSQLQLAGNPYLASLALAQADDRLLQLADPALTEVRRAIADEIAALDVMEKPDIAGVTLTLASLARVVDSLPLRQTAGTGAKPEAQGGDEQGGAARAWGAVKGAFTGLVRHTPPGDDKAPLLTPDAEPLIRSNLALQLQSARLSLLRGEQQVFEQSIDDAGIWISSYFDTESEPVASVLTTLAEIRDGYSSSTTPDISGSLRLLRQYEMLSEPAE